MRNDNYYLNVSRSSDLEKKSEKILYRFLEMLPGLLSWTTLLLAIVVSYFFPFLAAGFIIIFAFYWLCRTIYFSLYLASGFQIMKKNEKKDWLEVLESLPREKYSIPLTHWSEIYHLVIIPTYKESETILSNTLSSIANNNYPAKKIIVVLALEERAGPEQQKIARRVVKEFEDKFLELLITIHPANLPGEIAGKSSNETWGTRVVKEKVIDALMIPYQNIILTSLDSDTVVYPQYFACLTYSYLTVDNPTRTSFQPIPLYINNIWEASPISRVFAFSSTFWHTINQERPEKLITFSSHSMSFQALVDINYKQTNVVSEDSRIFWQCLLKFDGDYKVLPLHYPVSMDANVAPSFIQTAVNVYKQKRRWAYGAENIPYFLFGFRKNKKIPFLKKVILGSEVIEGQLTWATAPILIYFLGWLPIIFGQAEFSDAVFLHNLPIILSRVLTLSMLGLIVSVYLSILLLPPRPPHYGRSKLLILTIQWFLVPLTMIFFSALPALEAQTRLMLGKYLGFWPTPKFRKND